MILTKTMSKLWSEFLYSQDCITEFIPSVYITLSVYIALMHFLVYFMALDDKPKLEFASQRSASPGLRQPETPLERRDPSSPVQAPSPPQKTELPPSGPETASSVATAPTPSIPASTVESADAPSPSAEPAPTKAITPEPESSEPEKSSSEQPSPQSLSTSLAQPEKAINGLTDTDAAPSSEDLESQPREVSPLLPTSSVPQSPSPEPRPITPALEADSVAGKADSPSPPAEDSTGCPVTPSISTSTTAAISTTPAPPPGLTHPSQVSAGSAKRPSTGAELKDTGKETEALPDKKGEPFLQSRKSQVKVSSRNIRLRWIAMMGESVE